MQNCVFLYLSLPELLFGRVLASVCKAQLRFCVIFCLKGQNNFLLHLCFRSGGMKNGSDRFVMRLKSSCICLGHVSSIQVLSDQLPFDDRS